MWKVWHTDQYWQLNYFTNHICNNLLLFWLINFKFLYYSVFLYVNLYNNLYDWVRVRNYNWICQKLMYCNLNPLVQEDNFGRHALWCWGNQTSPNLLAKSMQSSGQPFTSMLFCRGHWVCNSPAWGLVYLKQHYRLLGLWFQLHTHACMHKHMHRLIHALWTLL